MEAVMRGMFAIAAAVVGLGTILALDADPNERPEADQPTPILRGPELGFEPI
jgi:hypothetical protein